MRLSVTIIEIIECLVFAFCSWRFHFGERFYDIRDAIQSSLSYHSDRLAVFYENIQQKYPRSYDQERKFAPLLQWMYSLIGIVLALLCLSNGFTGDEVQAYELVILLGIPFSIFCFIFLTPKWHAGATGKWETKNRG